MLYGLYENNLQVKVILDSNIFNLFGLTVLCIMVGLKMHKNYQMKI